MLSWRELRLLTRVSRLTAKWKNRSLPGVARLAAHHLLPTLLLTVLSHSPIEDPAVWLDWYNAWARELVT